jgi:hypothetical protein
MQAAGSFVGPSGSPEGVSKVGLFQVCSRVYIDGGGNGCIRGASENHSVVAGH